MVWKSLEALEEELRAQESLVDCPDEVKEFFWTMFLKNSSMFQVYAELAEQLVEQLDRRYREVARER